METKVCIKCHLRKMLQSTHFEKILKNIEIIVSYVCMKKINELSKNQNGMKKSKKYQKKSISRREYREKIKKKWKNNKEIIGIEKKLMKPNENMKETEEKQMLIID